MSDQRRPDIDPSTRPNDPLDTDIDPGAFVGNRPERQADTIPGGVRPDDERIAANSSQATGIWRGSPWLLAGRRPFQGER